jgi:hypothetical protein
MPGLALKSMPLSKNIDEAEAYIKKYNDYCSFLQNPD